MSERRSCGFVGMSRNGYRYRPVPRDDSQLLGVLRDYSRAHPCEGYRKAMAVARKELGEPVNHKKVERLWREEGLSVPRKRRRRRRGKGIPRAPVAEKTGHVWTMDFAEDSSQDGRKLRFLAITDEFTRECLVITTSPPCRARDVKHTLEGLFRAERRPDYIRCFHQGRGRSSRRGNSRIGPRSAESGPTPPSPASRGRTERPRASIAAFGENAWTGRFSTA